MTALGSWSEFIDSKLNIQTELSIDGSIVFDSSIERYGLSLKYEILQTKANFSPGQARRFS